MLVDKEVEKIVYIDRIKEVEKTVEVPVVSTKIKVEEKIIEKVIYVDSGAGGGDECISEANFVLTWNKLMHIPFANNVLTDNCLDEGKFMDLVSKNLANNYETYKKNALAKEK